MSWFRMTYPPFSNARRNLLMLSKRALRKKRTTHFPWSNPGADNLKCMGQENASADQTHHCSHCLEHCKTSFTPLRDTKRRQPCTVKKIPWRQQIIRLHRGFFATGVSKPGRRKRATRPKSPRCRGNP